MPDIEPKQIEGKSRRAIKEPRGAMAAMVVAITIGVTFFFIHRNELSPETLFGIGLTGGAIIGALLALIFKDVP